MGEAISYLLAYAPSSKKFRLFGIHFVLYLTHINYIARFQSGGGGGGGGGGEITRPPKVKVQLVEFLGTFRPSEVLILSARCALFKIIHLC